VEEDQNHRSDVEPVDSAVASLEQALERLDVELVPLNEDGSCEQTTTAPASSPDDSESPDADGSPSSPPPLYEDPTSEDDGEGEWITPQNITLHKARALGLTPSENGSVKGRKETTPIPVGCMTADFAMQNVLLQMDLSLVGMEGKRIEKVKTWVLRCHACFKCVSYLFHAFNAHPHSGSARTRRKNSALRVEILHFFARLSLYRPLLPRRTHQLCKCT